MARRRPAHPVHGEGRLDRGPHLREPVGPQGRRWSPVEQGEQPRRLLPGGGVGVRGVDGRTVRPDGHGPALELVGRGRRWRRERREEDTGDVGVGGERQPCAVRLGVGAGGVRLGDEPPVAYDGPVVPVGEHAHGTVRAAAGRAGTVGGGGGEGGEPVERGPGGGVHGWSVRGGRTRLCGAGSGPVRGRLRSRLSVVVPRGGKREGRSAPQLTGPTLPSAAPPSPRG